METATASFIIPAYNAERYLAEAIDSCIHQSVSPLQIIIIDDASSDSTRSIIRDYQKRYPTVVEPVFCDVNGGRAEARNRGIERLRSTYCLFLDADDVALPTRLERQIAFMEENPDIYASSAFINHINAKGKVIAKGAIPVVTRELYAKYMRENEVISLFTSATIIRTVVFQDKKLWFRSVFRQAQDTDLWIRISERYVVVAQAEYLANYRIHGSSVTTSRFMRARFYYDYARDCMTLRRKGLEERSLAEYVAFRKSQPMRIRANRFRKDTAKSLYHRAGLLYAERRRFGALFLFGVSSLLQPSYALKRIRLQIRKKGGG